MNKTHNGWTLVIEALASLCVVSFIFILLDSRRIEQYTPNIMHTIKIPWKMQEAKNRSQAMDRRELYATCFIFMILLTLYI